MEKNKEKKEKYVDKGDIYHIPALLLLDLTFVKHAICKRKNYDAGMVIIVMQISHFHLTAAVKTI